MLPYLFTGFRHTAPTPAVLYLAEQSAEPHGPRVRFGAAAGVWPRHRLLAQLSRLRWDANYPITSTSISTPPPRSLPPSLSSTPPARVPFQTELSTTRRPTSNMATPPCSAQQAPPIKASLRSSATSTPATTPWLLRSRTTLFTISSSTPTTPGRMLSTSIRTPPQPSAGNRKLARPVLPTPAPTTATPLGIYPTGSSPTRSTRSRASTNPARSVSGQ